MAREIDLDLAHTTISRGVHYFVNVNPYLLRFYDREDLINEVFAHFLEKEMIQKYNPQVTSFEYFIASAAKNYLIDLTRKRIHIMKSLSSKISNSEDGESLELLDVVQSTSSSDAELYVIIAELVERLPETQISPNYDLTWKELLEHVIKGRRPKEISPHVVVTRSGRVRNLSSGRIANLIKRLKDLCIEIINGEINRKFV